MELLACICALKWVRQNGPWTAVTRVQVFTDSRYVKDNLFRAREWKKNDWREPTRRASEKIRIYGNNFYQHAQRAVVSCVPSSGCLGRNPRSSRLLTKQQNRRRITCRTDTDYGYKPGTVARSMVKGAATRFPAAGQLIVIRPYRKNHMSREEEKNWFRYVLRRDWNFLGQLLCFHHTCDRGGSTQAKWLQSSIQRQP